MTTVRPCDQRSNEPALGRRISLTLQGDWGQANLHRICGWLAQEVGDRCEPGSEFLIRSGRGGTDAIHAVIPENESRTRLAVEMDQRQVRCRFVHVSN